MATKGITKSGARKAKPKAKTPVVRKPSAPSESALAPEETFAPHEVSPSEKGGDAQFAIREFYFAPYEYGHARYIDGKITIRDDDLVTLSVHVQSKWKTNKGGPHNWVTLSASNGNVFADKFFLGEMQWGCGQNGIKQLSDRIAGAFRHTHAVVWRIQDGEKGWDVC